MSFFTRDSKRIQTTWGECGAEKTWVANIDANIQDELVIEQAELFAQHAAD